MVIHPRLDSTEMDHSENEEFTLTHPYQERKLTKGTTLIL